MTTPLNEIRQALHTHLLLVLPEIGMTSRDVAWQNTVFKPEPEKVYLSPACIFNETETASLGVHGFERLKGIYQISVFGVLDAGEGAMEETAQALVDHFRSGVCLELPCRNAVMIDRAWAGNLRLTVGATQGGTSRPVIPVSARWTQYTQKGE